MYILKFTIKPKDVFESSMNLQNYSLMGIFNLVFTVIAIFVTIYLFVTKIFFDLLYYQRFVLILCCIMFPIIQPLIIYIKSMNRFRKIKMAEITYEIKEDGINASILNENSFISYDKIYRIRKFNNMLIIMYDTIHGQIIPDRAFTENNKLEIYNYILEKIKK